MYILMADDDADDRFLIQTAFEENHIAASLQFVEDGVELMDFLKGEGRFANGRMHVLPSLILLDLNMPRKDGRESLKEIKEIPRFRSIPIVVLSTSRAEKDIVDSYSLGANCFITKPVSYQGLMEVIKYLGKFWLEIATIPAH
jgi:CheY-like chemotaxis protein